jgi:hypothetical protein
MMPALSPETVAFIQERVAYHARIAKGWANLLDLMMEPGEPTLTDPRAEKRQCQLRKGELGERRVAFERGQGHFRLERR